MALFRKLFFRKPPDGLFEICERVFVFHCCFTTDAFEAKDYKGYVEGIIVRLRGNYPDALILAFNFREGETQSQISDVFTEYDMTIVEYPRQYEGCPLLPMEVIQHFLRSCESWLSLGEQNLLIMHCERGGWPVLAFMLSALLLYRKDYNGEIKTLEMVYRQGSCDLLQLLSPLNPIPSQLRYLQYVSRRDIAAEWSSLDRALTLDCIIFITIPNFDEDNGCRPIFRIYGQNPLLASDRTPKVLFSTPKRSMAVRSYNQAECELAKIDIDCHVQGDVVLECINLHEDTSRETMIFRVMFNTAFIRSNILMLNRDEIDILWDVKDLFPKDFRVEVLFSEMNTASTMDSTDFSCFEYMDGLPMEAFAKVHEIFNSVDWLDEEEEAGADVILPWTASDSDIIGEPYYNAEMAKMNQNIGTQDFKSAVTTQLTDVGERQAEGYDAPIEIRPFMTSEHIPIPPNDHSPCSSNSSLAVENISFTAKQHPNCNVSQSDVDKGTFLQSVTDPTYAKTFASGSQTNDVAVGIEPTCSSCTSASDPSSIPFPTTSLKENLAVEDGSPHVPPFTSHLHDGPTSTPEECFPPLLPPPLPPPPPPSLLVPPSSSVPFFPLKETSSLSSAAPPPSTPLLADHSVSSCSPSPSPQLPNERSKGEGSTINPQLMDTAITHPPRPVKVPTEKSSVGGPPPPPPLPPPSRDDTRPTNPPTLPSHAPAVNHDFSASSPSVPSAPPLPSLSTKELMSNSISNRGSGSSVSPSPPPPSIPPPGTKGKGPLSRSTTSKNSKKLKPLHWLKISRAITGSMWAEAQKSGEASLAPEIDMSELESLFSAALPSPDGRLNRKPGSQGSTGQKPEKVQLVDHRRASNCEIMLSKVKIPWRDMLSSVLALEDSGLDIDQVENLIKFCPTKEEMELLKGYTGEKDKLGKCEQFFLELMQVPRIEYKLRVFAFKIQFHSQVTDLRKSLNVINSAADQIRNSSKLRRIMQTILSLGNALNQGTARGSAVGFKLDSLLKLTETRARNNKMTLMHYLCKVLYEKLPELLDFWQDLSSMEPAAKIQLKFLAEEMQAINKGFDKVSQELIMSERDGPVSDQFCKALQEFLSVAEVEVRSLTAHYSGVGRNIDSLIIYFGEDPSRCPYEQVISTLLNFVRMFKKAHEENLKQLELEKKKAEKEALEKEKEHINTSGPP